jgi:hypothetical protein
MPRHPPRSNARISSRSFCCSPLPNVATAEGVAPKLTTRLLGLSDSSSANASLISRSTSISVAFAGSRFDAGCFDAELATAVPEEQVGTLSFRPVGFQRHAIPRGRSDRRIAAANHRPVISGQRYPPRPPSVVAVELIADQFGELVGHGRHRFFRRVQAAS